MGHKPKMSLWTKEPNPLIWVIIAWCPNGDYFSFSIDTFTLNHNPSVQLTLPVTPWGVFGSLRGSNVSKSSLWEEQEQEHPVSTMKEKAPLGRESFPCRSLITKSLSMFNAGTGDL